MSIEKAVVVRGPYRKALVKLTGVVVGNSVIKMGLDQ